MPGGVGRAAYQLTPAAEPLENARLIDIRRRTPHGRPGVHRNSFQQSVSRWWVVGEFLDDGRTGCPRHRSGQALDLPTRAKTPGASRREVRGGNGGKGGDGKRGRGTARRRR